MEKGRRRKKKEIQFYVLKAGPQWKWASVHREVCKAAQYIFFALSATFNLTHQAARSLTSIPACSEPGRIRRRPIRPSLMEADRRPSGHLRRSESSPTSAGSPEDARERSTSTPEQNFADCNIPILKPNHVQESSPRSVSSD